MFVPLIKCIKNEGSNLYKNPICTRARVVWPPFVINGQKKKKKPYGMSSYLLNCQREAASQLPKGKGDQDKKTMLSEENSNFHMHNNNFHQRGRKTTIFTLNIKNENTPFSLTQLKMSVLMSITQLIWTMHKICKVRV